MCAAFDRNDDIHSLVASQVFGVPLDEVTSSSAAVAKAVNFGVIYGQSPFGLAKDLGISAGRSRHVHRRLLHNLPRRRRVHGRYSRGLPPRRLRDHDPRPPPQHPRRPPDRPANAAHRPAQPPPIDLPERTAVNSVIQGTAADMIKLAMLAITIAFAKENSPAQMLLQIHDELVFEVPPDELDDVTQLVIEEMAEAEDLSVPLAVDIKTGKNWAE